MADDMDRELRELESFLLEAEKEEIAVPPVLESKIRERGKRLKRRVPFYFKTSAAAAVLLVALFTAALLIPQFAVYASNIPGIGTVLDWLRGDSGIEYARKYGYSVINGVTIMRDDYTIIINSIFFDEDRLSLKAAMEGPLVEDTTDNYEVTILEAFADLGEGVAGNISSSWDANSKSSRLVVDIEHIFEEGAAKKILDSDSKYIDVEICLYAENRSGERLDIKKEQVRIPFTKDKVLMSKVYDIDKQKEVKINNFINNIVIDVEKLAVSPTRLRLDTDIILPDGFSFSGFENARLEDEQGNIYSAENLVAVGTNLYFVPSVYFDVPKRLTFKYDGFRVAQEEGSSFTLGMDEPLPKTVEYMGEKIKILKAEYSDGKLSIEAVFPDPDILKIQNLDIEGSSSVGWSNMNPDYPFTTRCFIEIDERDEYEILFKAAGYLIEKSGEFDIPLISR